MRKCVAEKWRLTVFDRKGNKSIPLKSKETLSFVRYTVHNIRSFKSEMSLMTRLNAFNGPDSIRHLTANSVCRWNDPRVVYIRINAIRSYALWRETGGTEAFLIHRICIHTQRQSAWCCHGNNTGTRVASATKAKAWQTGNRIDNDDVPLDRTLSGSYFEPRSFELVTPSALMLGVHPSFAFPVPRIFSSSTSVTLALCAHCRI